MGVGTLSGRFGNVGQVRGGATWAAGGLVNNCVMRDGGGVGESAGAFVPANGVVEFVGGKEADAVAEGNGCAETIGTRDWQEMTRTPMSSVEPTGMR